MKEGLILKYLEGNCSKKQVADVQAWLAEDTAHSKEMLIMQKIWNEIDGLKEFNDFSVDQEWQKFSSALPSQGDVNLGEASSSAELDLPESKFTTPSTPTSTAPSNPSQTKEFKEGRTQTSTPIIDNSPKTEYPIIQNESENNLGWLKMLLTFLGLLALGFLIYNLISTDSPKVETIEHYAEANEMEVELPDGSLALLAPYSKMNYPKSYSSSQRQVSLLQGGAEFDVLEDRKPFVVNYGDVSVLVKGTIFSFNRDNIYATVSCLDGEVRFFATDSTAHGADMSKGQIFRYGNGIFEDITPLPEEPPLLVPLQNEITLGNLLDWLMESSDWKVATAPSMPLDINHVVAVDLESGYISVLDQLNDQINLEFTSASCEGCYLLKRMTAE